jgi:hypothetical protein
LAQNPLINHELNHELTDSTLPFSKNAFMLWKATQQQILMDLTKRNRFYPGIENTVTMGFSGDHILLLNPPDYAREYIKNIFTSTICRILAGCTNGEINQITIFEGDQA